MFIRILFFSGWILAQTSPSDLIKNSKYCLDAPLGSAVKTNTQVLRLTKDHEAILTIANSGKTLQLLVDNAKQQARAWTFEIPANAKTLILDTPDLSSLLGGPLVLESTNGKWTRKKPEVGRKLKDSGVKLSAAAALVAEDMKAVLLQSLVKDPGASSMEIQSCYAGIQALEANYHISSLFTDKQRKDLDEAFHHSSELVPQSGVEK